MEYRKVKSVEELLSNDPRLIQAEIMHYIVAKRKNSSCNKITHGAALYHFYDMNDVVLKWKKINAFLSESTRKIEHRAYTKKRL